MYLSQLFAQLPDSKMTKDTFIVYMMGYRMKMEQLAVARFAMQK
jgi:hypothetical protein